MISALLLSVILLLSCGLGSSKSMEDALKELLAVMNKIGTGRCRPTEFSGFMQSAKGRVYFILSKSPRQKLDF